MTHFTKETIRSPNDKCLGGKICKSSKWFSMICSKCSLPIVDAKQMSDCGCRQCSKCFDEIKKIGKPSLKCDKCTHMFDINKVCFRVSLHHHFTKRLFHFLCLQTFNDKAIARELNSSMFPCYFSKCEWMGNNVEYRVCFTIHTTWNLKRKHTRVDLCFILFQNHLEQCTYREVLCPNEGCSQYVSKDILDVHLESCECKVIACRWCNKTGMLKDKEVRVDMSFVWNLVHRFVLFVI